MLNTVQQRETRSCIFKCRLYLFVCLFQGWDLMWASKLTGVGNICFGDMIFITYLYWASVWWPKYLDKRCSDHTLGEEWRHQYPKIDFHLLLILENIVQNHATKYLKFKLLLAIIQIVKQLNFDFSLRMRSSFPNERKGQLC